MAEYIMDGFGEHNEGVDPDETEEVIHFMTPDTTYNSKQNRYT